MVKPRIGDIIIIALILTITAGVFCFRLFGFGEGGAVVIETESETFDFSLSEDKTVDIRSNGITLSVVIKNKSVRVESSDCPSLDCVNMGSISKVGETIACVPARVYIKITGEGADGHDAVLG